MPHEEIDGVPIWYQEHGDPNGPPLVALHGGILTFERSFGDVLPWLTQGRRVIGVELQGHGHTADTGRPMSIERFADDVAELVDRVIGGGPADLWGFSLGALTATGVAVRHPSKVRPRSCSDQSSSGRSSGPFWTSCASALSRRAPSARRQGRPLRRSG